MDASLWLFVGKGFEGTTVRDIAAAAGVSAGLMFHYFPSKFAILEAHVVLAEQGISSVLEVLKATVDPLATFSEIATLTLSSFADPRFRRLYLLISQVLSFETMPREAVERLGASRIVATSTPVIEKGQQTGQFRAGNPASLAVAFWGAIQGIAEVLAWNPGAPVPDAETVLAVLKA